MPTSFDAIEDLALVVIRDYKIDKLYNLSEEQQKPELFTKYIDSFLIEAIPNFTRCKQDLSVDLENRNFYAELTFMEQSILADLWVIAWLKKEIQDVTQIQNKLQVSSAFTSHSASQNLKEKSTYLDKLNEEVDWKITQYQLQDLPFPNADSAPSYFGGW